MDQNTIATHRGRDDSAPAPDAPPTDARSKPTRSTDARPASAQSAAVASADARPTGGSEVVRRRRPDDRIVASLVLGVAGLFLFNVVFGPLAIVLGLWALRRPPVDGRGRGFAGLGVVLGFADLVILAILLIGGAHGASLLHVST